jgi:aspartate aminotransferase
MKGVLPAFQTLSISPIFHIQAQAAQSPGCVRLEIGEPNFRTPAHIRQAAEAALEARPLTYGPPQGLSSLREALTAKLQRVNGYTTNPEQLCITAGGTGALMAILHVLSGPGDEVLIPDPAWPLYTHMLTCLGAQPVYYRLRPEAGWLPDLEELERLVSPRTKLLLINSPSNPTGAVFPRALVEQLVDFARRHDLYLLSDEAYDELVYEGEHISPAALCDDGRVLGAYTFSKTYAMTGWRIGYTVASPEITRGIVSVSNAMCNNVTHLAQWAAEAALSGPQGCVAEMREAYHQRRDAVLEILREYGMKIHAPQGAFYVLVDISAAKRPSLEFALRLLNERNIAVAPGSAFGETIDGYVRISLASALSDLQAGIAGLCESIREQARS